MTGAARTEAVAPRPAPPGHHDRRPATSELERALGATILDRRPLSYRSTFPLEELAVDGSEGRIVFKDLSRQGPADPVWRTKPAFLRDPLREIETYRDVLTPHRLSAPRYLGATIEPAPRDSPWGRYWLFLERVEGDPLWQVGEPEAWNRAAAWLAEMHGRFHERPEALPRRLVVHDARHYRRWLERMGRFAPSREPSPSARSTAGSDLERVARRARSALGWLAEQPVTLLHGELYPSNVLVERSAGGPRIRPLDWEMAGVGPGLLDLAALASGAWSAPEREALAEAYRAALPGRLRPSAGELREGLDRCRLLLAVQWLGWAPRWSPPPEHAHDWLATAIELAAEVPA